MNTDVSIIICTRNRAESLRMTLRSIADCAVPGDVSAEILIIDNGSTDHTRDIVLQANMPHLPVRHVLEPKPGLSNARNRGVTEGRGKVLLFTDDDVRPPVAWIEGMCRPILNGEADAVAGGVHVPPHYDAILNRGPYPARRGWFACTEGIDAERPTRMVGANMAFSRLVADAVGRFDPALGAGALGFYEETLFSWQMIGAGFRLVSRFGVSVEHHFDLGRINSQCLLSIAQRIGRSEGYVAHHWERQPAPALSQAVRARVGLWLRKLLRLDRFWREQAQEWELIRVERTAVVEMRYALRNEPRKYQRNARAETSMAGADVSIIIATRDRAQALAATLESLGAAAIPESCIVELILVDNGSTDATPHVIANFCPKSLTVRRVTEPVGGKSRALNAGISVAKGEVILFTDDDVRLPADWISRMREPILRGDCDAAVGGIAAGPHRDVKRMFLTPALFDPLAADTPPILIGANMAIHRRVVDKVGLFDVELGPGAIGMGEDTHYSHRVEKAGFRIRAIPDAQAEHWFDVDRCGAGEQRKTARQLARAGAYIDYHLHEKASLNAWMTVLKSWSWLARLRVKRACLGGGRYPLTGWELHQEGEVAYGFEYLNQQLRSRPQVIDAAGRSVRGRVGDAARPTL